MTKEVWKNIKDYEGYYQVSNLGRVRSIDREIINQGALQPVKGRILKAGVRNKYKSVILCMNGEVKNHSVHRLVAEAFVDNDDDFPVVNHIDENKLNNNSNNLEWCTQEQNLKKSSTNKSKGRKVGQYTLKGDLVKIWKNAHYTGQNSEFDGSLIRKCCTGRRNKHKGYLWKYI